MMVRLWFFFQAEDGIRDLVRSRGLGDVYKRQTMDEVEEIQLTTVDQFCADHRIERLHFLKIDIEGCLLYTSDAADERSSVDLGGRRIIKKKKTH